MKRLLLIAMLLATPAIAESTAGGGNAATGQAAGFSGQAGSGGWYYFYPGLTYVNGKPVGAISTPYSVAYNFSGRTVSTFSMGGYNCCNTPGNAH